VDGFTHDLMDDHEPESKSMDKKRTEEMLEEVGKWLFKGPFAK
jgi:hypothetical protein